MGHQLLGNLFRECRIEPASDVDRHQFLVLALVVCFEFRALKREVGLFGVCLRADRHVLPGSHRHRTSHQASDPGDQDVAVSRMRSGNTEQQTRC